MPMVDFKIHWLNMMSVPESRAAVGRADEINGRDSRQPVRIMRQPDAEKLGFAFANIGTKIEIRFKHLEPIIVGKLPVLGWWGDRKSVQSVVLFCIQFTYSRIGRVER